MFQGQDAASQATFETMKDLSNDEAFAEFKFVTIETWSSPEVAAQFPAEALPMYFVFTPGEGANQYGQSIDRAGLLELNEFRKFDEKNNGALTSVLEYDGEQALYDLAQTNQVYIKLYEEWCGQCKKMKKHFDYVAATSTSSMKFMEIECSASGDNICQKFGVKGYPTLITLDKGSRRFSTYNGERVSNAMRTFVEDSSSITFDQDVDLEHVRAFYELYLMSRYWTMGVIAAYLVLYTAYDKLKKTLIAENLFQVLFFTKGAQHSFDQLNKVISLAALTNLAFAVTPGFEYLVDNCGDLITTSTLLLGLHSMYSLYRYYGTNNIPVLSSFKTVQQDFEKKKTYMDGIRKVSILFGVASTLIIELWLFDYLSINAVTILSALLLGLLHFYYMEVDFKMNLNVRPFGYLAFVAPTVAIVGLVVNMFM